MDDEEFGKTIDYLRAFQVVYEDGIHDKHLDLLRAHLAAPLHSTTWNDLARSVGYTNGQSVNLQYGKFAERIARQLGLKQKPRDPHDTAWWLWALVRWSEKRDPESGHTVFILRRPVVEALTQLGIADTPPFTILPDEFQAAPSIREGARCQVIVNAYERNSLARQLCIAEYGTACTICGFSFGDVYGPVADGFIHVHHLRPLSEIGSEYEINPVQDLRPVCPNCHAVLHHRKPAFSIEEVREFLRSNKLPNQTPLS